MNRFTLAALVAALAIPSVALAHPSFEAHGHDFVFAAPLMAQDAQRERDDDARARLDRIEAQRAKDEAPKSNVNTKGETR